MDVAEWLGAQGLERHARAFQDNAVDWAVLPRLTAEDLKELGVTAVGERRRLLDAIAALAAATPPAPPAESEPEPEGERRQVIVLFADLVGYTALGRELDAEDLHALVDRFFARVDDIVEAHGGHVDKHIGDCVMAVFGAPVARGNEPERAVRAALAIRDAMPGLSAETGRGLRVHLGVAGGEVVASRSGGDRHRAYTVTGDTVNLAARLADAAGPGEILLSESVRRTLGERLAGADAGGLRAKGFAEPLAAFRLAGLDAPAARQRPFVGRRNELAQLRAALAGCRDGGAGQTVYLRGEAGIGKTRLVEELQRLAAEAGFACHAGLVLDFGAAAGAEALRRLVVGLLEVEPEAAALRAGVEAAIAAGRVDAADGAFLGDLLGLAPAGEGRALYDAMDDAQRALGRRRALVRLVAGAARERPRLLALEDIHWADGETLAYLAALAGALAECPALLVLTSRLEGDPLDRAWRADSAGAPLLTLDLGPLRDDEARALTGMLSAARAAVAERCIERAAGNPLFLDQLLRHAEESAEAGVPGSVQSLVQARLDRLEPADKAALQAVSVLGQRFEVGLARHLLRDESYDPRRLVAHFLVRPSGEGGYLFAHALIRDAVYDSLLKSRRRLLHRRAAEWFAGRDAARHAEHLDRAGDPAAAAAYLAAAAAEAGAYRPQAALRLAERGLALAGGGERSALACLKGDLLHDLGAMPAARQAYEAALAAAATGLERCRARIGLAAVKRVTDELDGAFADLDRAEAEAIESAATAERARIHFLRGNLLFPRNEIEACLEQHRLSLELARAAGSAELEAAALGGLGDGEYARGRVVSAHRRFGECIALAHGRGFGRIEVANRPMLAITRCWAEGPRAALAETDAAIEAAARVGHDRARVIAHHSGYFCRHELGELDAAWVDAEISLELARRLKARRFEGEALAFRGALRHLAGRRAKALADLRRALAIGRETGMAYSGPYVLGVLALATDDEAARAAALAEAEALLADNRISHNNLLFRRDAIEACLEAGDWPAAEHHAEALERYVGPEPLPLAGFLVARGRALAAAGRGEGGARLAAALERLRLEGQRLGAILALTRIERALAAVGPPPPE